MNKQVYFVRNEENSTKLLFYIDPDIFQWILDYLLSVGPENWSNRNVVLQMADENIWACEQRQGFNENGNKKQYLSSERKSWKRGFENLENIRLEQK